MIAETQDPRLLGATSIALVNDHRVVISAPPARRLVMVSTTSPLDIMGDTGDIGCEPGAVLLLSSAIWTICSDGKLRKYSTADTPILSVTTDVHATSSQWLAATSSLIVAPGNPSSVVICNTSGTILYTHDGIAPDIQAAVCNSSVLYVADGAGTGHIFLVSSTGNITKRAEFTIPNGLDVLSMNVDGTDLIVVTGNRLIVFDITSPYAPVLSSSTVYDFTIHGLAILEAGEWWLATDEGVETQAYRFLYPASGAGVARGLIALHGNQARASYTNPTLSLIGDSVNLVNLDPLLLNTLVFDAVVNYGAISGDLLYVGGAFTTVTDSSGVHNRSKLACIDMTTGLVTDWDHQANNAVQVIAIDPLGRIWAGGAFTTIDGLTRGHLVLFNADGTLNSFSAGCDGDVYGLDFSSTLVYISGPITQLLGNTRIGAGAIDLNTFNLDTFDPELSTANGKIRQVHLTDAGNIWIVGSITASNGTMRSGGCTFDATGALRSTDPNMGGLGGAPDCIDDFGGITYIGGDFNLAGGSTRNRATAFNDTTGALETWNPNCGDSVYGLSARAGDGYIYLAGNFTSVGGQSRRFAARVDLTGAVQAWNPGLTSGTIARGVLTLGGYAIILGDFTNPSGGVGIYAMAT